MKPGQLLSRALGAMALMTVWGCMGVSAGSFGIGNVSTWQEEVVLHDGSKIIVTRTLARGGQPYEMGQRPPPKEQELSFTLPGTSMGITWEDRFSKELSMINFIPMLLDIVDGTPYLVVSPMGCLSYNKWGRPNPPYVVFKYWGREWVRIPLQELPVAIKTPNLIFSAPDIAVKRLGKNYASAEAIRKIINSYKQPEHKNLLREPIATEQIDKMCIEMIHYKCGWISPHGTFGREFMDRTCK